MNRDESIHAAEVLAASPAAEWISNRSDGEFLLQCCTRCGAQEQLKLPTDLLTAFKDGKRGNALAGQVPEDFDAKLFAWKKAFQVVHEDCVASGSAS